jgi:hypothetical protein
LIVFCDLDLQKGYGNIMHRYKVISGVMSLKIVDWIVDTNVLGALQDPMLGDLILTVVCNIAIGTDPQERKK